MRLQSFFTTIAAIPLFLALPSEGLAQTTSESCVVSSATLEGARALYQQQCVMPRADCDFIDGNWYCADIDLNGSSAPATPTASQPQVANSSSSSTNGVPVCSSLSSDSDGDGWGWENQRSCLVGLATATSSSSAIPPGDAPPPVAAATAGFSGGQPICLTNASEVNNSGFGFESNQTCVVTAATATRNQPLLNHRSCTPWFEIPYGNYVLQNNTWNSAAVFSNDWSQCITLSGSAGNYVAGWDYNWLPRAGGNEYAVKSYPQVFYGRKTQYNSSGSVAQTGLPASIDNLPRFLVDYDYSETGQVERNVALESFFHTSCDAEEHNKQYEMMVWVGVPSIRTPGVFNTSVTLSGQEWDVYTNPQLGWAYVAFVAKEPSNKGTLDWNAFVNWSRFNGPSFGVPAMANRACMGAIEIGTETFWGTGTFTLNRFNVRRGGQE